MCAPLSKLPCPYRQAVSMFTEAMPFLSDDEREAVMGASLRRWIGWDD